MPSLSTPQVPRKRRRFSATYKAKIVALCRQPGVSVARIALEHQLNANLVRRWIRHQQAPVTAPPAFVPVVMPASSRPLVGTPSDTIRIELPRAEGTVVVHWPVAQADTCLTLLRNLLA